jgi:hypothetical protein
MSRPRVATPGAAARSGIGRNGGGEAVRATQTAEESMNDLNALAARYIEMWNEPDAGKRNAIVRELFAPAAVHYTPTREFHGLERMEARVTEGYEQFVRPGANVFRLVAGANGHHGAVRFVWEMVEVTTGRVTGRGSDFLLMDEDGRILSDHQFIGG